MKLDIAGEKENPVLKRRELDVAIEHPEEATPSRAALQQLLAKQLSLGVEHIDIKQVFSGRGLAKSRAVVFLWEEKKAEDLSKKKAKEEKQEVPVEEKAAAEKEKKEEAKSEAKAIEKTNEEKTEKQPAQQKKEKTEKEEKKEAKA